MRLLNITYLFPFLILLGCGKAENDILIKINPTELNTSARAGTTVEFVINATSVSPISNLRIFSKLQNSPEVTILDSAFSIPSKSVSFSYFYKVPDFLEDTSVILRFQIWDKEGNTFQAARQLFVKVDSKPLNESGSFQIYSSKSGNLKNAFNIESLTYATLNISDSSAIDVFDPGSGDTLSRIWRSKTGVKFVRFNEFNYAQATSVSIRSAFMAGNKLDAVTNLRKDDVILLSKTKAGSTIFAALRLKNIANQLGPSDNYYEFYVKK